MCLVPVAPDRAVGLIPSHLVTSHHSSSHCRSNEGDLAGDESAKILDGWLHGKRPSTALVAIKVASADGSRAAAAGR